MNLVADRAELRRVPVHRLEKRAAMRLGIQIGEDFVECLDVLVLVRGDLVQPVVFEQERRVPHGALHMDDGVARYTRQSSPSLRRIDLIFDRLVPSAAEQDGRIVAGRAPLAGLGGALFFLHELNRLAVELIVEAGKVMHRSLPLFVDVLVTFPAELRVSKLDAHAGKTEHPELSLNGCGRKVG